jgi:hypothetical protein
VELQEPELAQGQVVGPNRGGYGLLDFSPVPWPQCRVAEHLDHWQLVSQVGNVLLQGRKRPCWRSSRWQRTLQPRDGSRTAGHHGVDFNRVDCCEGAVDPVPLLRKHAVDACPQVIVWREPSPQFFEADWLARAAVQQLLLG